VGKEKWVIFTLEEGLMSDRKYHMKWGKVYGPMLKSSKPIPIPNSSKLGENQCLCCGSEDQHSSGLDLGLYYQTDIQDHFYKKY